MPGEVAQEGAPTRDTMSPFYVLASHRSSVHAMVRLPASSQSIRSVARMLVPVLPIDRLLHHALKP